MNKAKMIKNAFKVLKQSDPQTPEECKSLFNEFLSQCGIPILENVEVPNKAAPALDTLDFDEISDFFDEND